MESRTEIPFDYKLFDGNTITLGFEYRLISQTNVSSFYNFYPPTLDPLPSIQDFSDDFPWIKEVTRRLWSVYLQDIWDITNTLNLTLGVRHDQYSDFGAATSPRGGLTWAFMKNASLKVLYGEAFRAPSFIEMFIKNQPALLGNEDLDPEKIKTYEVGLSYQFNKHVTSSINYFYNDIKDMIVLRSLPPPNQSTSQYDNFGDAHVQGIEMETKVDIIKDNYIFMNYTFQDPRDNHGNDLPFVAQHYGNFGVNVHYWKYINTNMSTFVSGRRSREEGDDRDDLPAYALLNLSVIGKEFFKTMEIQGTVFNLLDKDYSDPGPTSIPDDLPRPERTFFVGLSYQF
ncbi:MAG: TonB-dependent receptor [Candidatus Omnitrophica bacterium]|nr:TonB-dependent receptor [Candidatus Omnitrophota bacterium]